MHFSVSIALLIICSTLLLEAVPMPQVKSVQKQRWRPKAVREKEAAEAAARAAEEAAKAAAEEAARALMEVTTQIVEDVTEIVQDAVTDTKEIVGLEKDDAIVATTFSNDIKINPSTVTDEPFDTNVVVTTTTATTQKDIAVADLSASEKAITARESESTKIRVSTNGKAEVSTLSKKSAQAPVEIENFCRLSLRGKSCICRFEKTCRCDCGRIISANNQNSAKTASNRGINRRLRIENFQFPKSNKH